MVAEFGEQRIYIKYTERGKSWQLSIIQGAGCRLKKKFLSVTKLMSWTIAPALLWFVINQRRDKSQVSSPLNINIARLIKSRFNPKVVKLFSLKGFVKMYLQLQRSMLIEECIFLLDQAKAIFILFLISQWPKQFLNCWDKLLFIVASLKQIFGGTVCGTW